MESVQAFIYAMAVLRWTTTNVAQTSVVSDACVSAEWLCSNVASCGLTTLT